MAKKKRTTKRKSALEKRVEALEKIVKELNSRPRSPLSFGTSTGNIWPVYASWMPGSQGLTKHRKPNRRKPD